MCCLLACCPADAALHPQHTAPCAFQQQAAGDLLYMFMAGPPGAAAPAQLDGMPDAAMLLCTETSTEFAAEPPAAAECPEVPLAATSLAARFARLPEFVQDDIMRQLDELSAMEDEARAMQEPEQQGPRVRASMQLTCLIVRRRAWSWSDILDEVCECQNDMTSLQPWECRLAASRSSHVGVCADTQCAGMGPKP
jgi:hypothetical protein